MFQALFLSKFESLVRMWFTLEKIWVAVIIYFCTVIGNFISIPSKRLRKQQFSPRKTRNRNNTDTTRQNLELYIGHGNVKYRFFALTNIGIDSNAIQLN